MVETNRTDVVASLTLDQDAESFDELAFRQKLATLYGVPISKIILSTSSGSLIVNYKIVGAGLSVAATSFKPASSVNDFRASSTDTAASK